jgi:LPXTG-motif cell wall-anchored protein
MRSPLRLSAVAAIGLGALLLATVLASPALAWHSNVAVNAFCLDDGQVRVNYTVSAWEPGQEATVEVSYQLNGETVDLPSGRFRADDDTFAGHVDLPVGTTGTITVTADAHWVGGHESSNSGSDELPPADKCAKSTSTTAPPTTAPPTTAPPTTAPPTSATVAPSSSLAATTTTESAVGAATSTTSGGGQLPFTGASSGPMLLIGIALVGGGALFLLLSRRRDQAAS